MQYINGSRYPTVTDKGIYGFFHQYRWLSNFHMCSVHIQNMEYPSSEHAYMAMKTLKTKYRRMIRDLDTPQQAKALGQKVPLRPDWDNIRVQKMRDVLKCKFIQNKDLRILLRRTRDLYLEETNDWGDRFWGVVDGVGENNLGLTLMAVRKELFS